MKNNNIFDKESISKTWDYIKRAKNITMLTHFKPDPDGMSACAALSVFLKNKFKDADSKNIEIIYPSSPEFEYERMPKDFLVNKFSHVPDLIISLDTSTYSRLYYPDEFKNIPLINIDHHISNVIKGDLNFVEPLSSACEILFYLLEAFDKESINIEIADFLLFGMLSDSKCFRTSSTTINTLGVASTLMSLGASLYQLQMELISIKTPQVMKFWGKILQDIKNTKNGNAVWVKVKRDDFKRFGVDSKALVGFVNFLCDFCKNDIAALFYENEMGKVQVSLRSKFSDVNAIANIFGGGGHRNAAGILTIKNIDEIENLIVSFLENESL